MFSQTLLTVGLATLASAHMVIEEPVPYGRSNLNNGPLAADGSDFPCKLRDGVYDLQGASNVYSLGSSGNPLRFKGSAVHGGGSCQVVMTYDPKPDKNSQWKVITSIEGGCPAAGQEGNLGNDANLATPGQYSFDVPADIPAGNGTIAWIWFNKIGNREMYMNCGPLTLTGTGGSQASYDALPDMFRANIGKQSEGCSTEEGTDVAFPNPGSVVYRFNGATDAFKTPAAAACTGKAGGGGGGAPAPQPTPTAAPPADSPPAPTPTPSIPGGVFIPVPTPPATPDAPPAEPTAAPVPNPGNGGGDDAKPPVVEQPPKAPADGDAAPGAQTVGSACASEGAWNCIGGTSFQRCASGVWSAIIALAEGTGCAPGQSSDFSMLVTRNGRKRVVRYSPAA